MIRIELPFGLGPIELVHDGNRWSGTSMLRGEPLALALGPGSAPPYLAAEVRFASVDAQLAGTVLIPAATGRHPAVVVVHGSGDASREQWEYRGYADLLARRGFVVLLYDKRGCGASTGAHWGDDVDFDGLARDALAAVEVLRSRADVDPARVGMIGGSQAGWVMLLAASRSPSVAFFIGTSVAAVTPMEQMIQSTEARMRADGIAQEEIVAGLAHMRLYADVAATGLKWEALRGSVASARASRFAEYVFLPTANPRSGWMGRHTKFDPAPLLARIRIPALALWGGADVIVPAAENADRYRAASAQSDAKLVSTIVFPGADHRLEVPSGRDASGAWHWFGMAPGLIEAIDTWLRTHGMVSSAP